jgi:hypothetical protein
MDGISVATESQSDNCSKEEQSGKGNSGWLRFALLTAASAVAGGIATAWFYRKTLAKLRETGESAKNPHFGIDQGTKADDSADEI